MISVGLGEIGGGSATPREAKKETIAILRTTAAPMKKKGVLGRVFSGGTGGGEGWDGSGLTGILEMRSGICSGVVLKAWHRSVKSSWQEEKRVVGSLSRARRTIAERWGLTLGLNKRGSGAGRLSWAKRMRSLIVLPDFSVPFSVPRKGRTPVRSSKRRTPRA